MNHQSENKNILLDDSTDETTAIFTFEKKMRRKDSVGWIISALLLFFLTVISIGRVTLVGQFFDDAIFNLFFGWFKYVVYFLLLVLSLSLFIGIKFHLKRRVKLMLLVLILILCWIVSSSLLIYQYLQNLVPAFNRNIFINIITDYFNNWKQASIFNESHLSFLGFNGQWIVLAAGGGIIGTLFAGITSYLSIFGAFILAILALFLWFTWVFTGHPLSFINPAFAKRKHKKIKIVKIEANSKRKNSHKHNSLYDSINLINSNKHATRQVIHSTEESDITIEMPSFGEYHPNIIDELMGNNKKNDYKENYVRFDNIKEKKQENTHRINYENLSSRSNYDILNKQQFNTSSQAEIDRVRNKIISSTEVTPFGKIDNSDEITNEEKNWDNTDNYTAENNNDVLSPVDNSDILDDDDDESEKTVSQTQSVFADIDDKNFVFNHDLEVHNKMINQRIKNMSIPEKKYDFNNKIQNQKIIAQPKIAPSINRSKNKYKLPPISLLTSAEFIAENNVINEEIAQNKVNVINNVFNQFNIAAEVKNYHIGPTITKFEIEITPGVKVNKITSLENDLKYALATKNVRIEAPIQGKSAVGIEVANKKSNKVSLRDIINNVPKDHIDNKLLVAIGKSVTGENLFAELNKMPHLLVAGSTGSGKSVCINTILSSVLLRAKPDEVKLLLIDPKQVELAVYNDLPHLLSPVITNPKLANGVLKKVISEMEHRYRVFSENNARNIEAYNKKITDGPLMPYILIVIDELADLMMVAGKDLEDSIMRITQLARAAGIHLVLATQRPSTDVITGVIKTNIPSRISFAVASAIDSRTILDQSGAEKLIGYGDMLYLPTGQSIPTRAQGAYISDEELEELVAFCKSQQDPDYESDFISVTNSNSEESNYESNDNLDDLYYEVKRFIILNQKASTSLVQRKFSIGYNRASKIIDMLEENDVIGPQNGAKPREVYIKNIDLDDNE